MTTEPHIRVTLNRVLQAKKITAKEMAQAIDISEQNLSLLRRGKALGIRLSTLNAICHYLDCQPGDLLALDG